MNKRFLAVMAALLSGMLFLAGGVLIAADVPEEVTIENQGYERDIKGPVTLNHNKHVTEYKVACTDCHHDYQDGKNVWKEGDPVKKCIECHNPAQRQGDVFKLQNAYHRNCKTCHQNAFKAGKKDAPFRKCDGCHAEKAR